MSKGALVGEGRIAEVFAWGEAQVVKLYRAWVPVDWLEHEYRIAQIVEGAGLAVPRVGDRVEVEGRHGIIYERLDGPTMYDDMQARPWALIRMARALAELHVTMHACTMTDLPLQRENLESRIRTVEQLSDREKDAVLAMLVRLPDGRAVCHGDFHPGNVLMTARGPVVIDWQDASQGSPVADVARTLLLGRNGHLWAAGRMQRALSRAAISVFATSYTHHYRRLRGISRGEIDAWRVPLAAARLIEEIPQEEDRLLATVRAGLRDNNRD